jgi:monoamine oxidase
MILGGYGQLANGLASTPTPLNIQFDQSVQQITYSRGNRRTPELDEPPVTVICDSGEIFQADAVAVTVSLGVLKSGMIAFDPELPDRKRSAISRLGFGLLNKVLVFSMCLTLGCFGLPSSVLGHGSRCYRMSTNP